MKRIEILTGMICYLLQPEDTTDTGRSRMSADCLYLQKQFPWLGVLKSIFWIMAAIIVPILIFLILSHVSGSYYR